MFRRLFFLAASCLLPQPAFAQTAPKLAPTAADLEVKREFDAGVRPFLKKHCFRCHDAKEMESGIRVDQLDGSVPERYLRLWQGIRHQLSDQAMPPEDEPQPTVAERKKVLAWIEKGINTARSRAVAKNGSVRRLTVQQYANTLRDLLGIEDRLAEALPPDAVTKDGFVNNGNSMVLSPLLLEAYFDVAERALDLCLVDPDARPAIQNFRMDLGDGVNPEPCPDKLILGALSMLLDNDDFMVTQLNPNKPFEYTPFRMRTKYRFIEGYQGNATVRGWREFDSIYHAVFACVRGNGGYPKGNPYDSIPGGLLLRPAIPSAELFQVESTYGPKANFKISLRELPDHGRFRVTVNAAKYNDGLLLDRAPTQPETPDTVTVKPVGRAVIPRDGVYQVDVYLKTAATRQVEPDASRLSDGLGVHWTLDGESTARAGEAELTGRIETGTKFVDSPLGQAVDVDGKTGALITPRHEAMNVGVGEFTVAAWINPRQLRQAGIVSLGGYGYTHGWVFDMPNGDGVLRLETSDKNSQLNGTVQSRPKVIRPNQWQHVAVTVRRGENQTLLYVNGQVVGRGTIKPGNLDNPEAELHIGRVPSANLFNGAIDDVRLYRRSLAEAEIQALVEPGRKHIQPLPSEPRKQMRLRLGDRVFDGKLSRFSFVVVQLPAGPLSVSAEYEGATAVDRVVFNRLEDDSELGAQFRAFTSRAPRVGVHVGLRRDCGSTLSQVGEVQSVASTEFRDYVFTDAISNFPSPDVEENNVNYLAGVREIGVRSEYTDGRDMPRLWIRSIEFEGPYYEMWPPAAHRKIFVDFDRPDDHAAYAREILRRFATRAYRRPVARQEEDALVDVWRDSFAASGDFRQSIKDALLVALTSPQFLFLIETSATPQPEPLEDWELASKLSYFLWNTAPDSATRRLASERRLTASLDSEVARLIDDERFEQFTREFISQWLRLDKLDVVETDRMKHPRLTRDTKTQLRREPIEFVQHLIRENLSVSHLVKSDFVVANEIVASYYDLGSRTESGFQFEPIQHENPALGGLLSQAGILAGLSDGRESNPVKRGAWLARKIIAEPPDDPPPNVPALDEDLSHLTLRERLAKHRNQRGCANCHAGIDPWGLPFEQYDAGGLWKQGKVDAQATLPDKTTVDGVASLKDYLADERIDQVAFSFLKHLSVYAIGRELTYKETESLRERAQELRDTGYGMRDMVGLVVHSPWFLEK